MKRTIRKGLMLAAVIALAWAPSAWAACTLDAQPVFHTFGLPIGNCPDANPVTGHVYLLASPGTVNSGAQSGLFVCNEDGLFNGIGLPCAFGAGTPGDGNVTVYYDFGVFNGLTAPNGGSIGCPNQAQNPGFPVAVQVVCNNGASALIEAGFDLGSSTYNLDFASPGDTAQVFAGFENGPALVSFNAAGPTPSADNVCVNVPSPLVHTDCDPAAIGFGTSCLATDVRPAHTRGQLYVREAACGSSPDPRNVSPWVLTPVQPDTTPGPTLGDACNLITRPTTAGMCAFLGATARIGGTETGSMAGWLQISGPAASNDKVKIDHAAFAQGKLIVAFSTINETSIVGFNVYSGANKLNGSLINAKGAGSNAYTFEVGRGALKGGKSVLVEAVKSDGSVEKTAPVTLK
jgi:hypothetical protein